MADGHDATERTEAASPRLIARVREQGSRPHSRELIAACGLLGGLWALRLVAGPLVTRLMDCMRLDLSRVSVTYPLGASTRTLGSEPAGAMLPALAIVLLVTLAAAWFAAVCQVGLRFRPAVFGLDLNRLDPVTGLARIFSRDRAIASLTGILKGALVLAYGVHEIWAAVGRCVAMSAEPGGLFAAQLACAFLSLSTRIAAVLVVLGLVDYACAWGRWQTGLRMSRGELAAELREAEGDPAVRGRRRQRYAERAGDRSIASLTAADLIFTGKGRLTVAVGSRSAGTMVVLAKHIGTAADRLERAGRACGARRIRDDGIARALYRAGQVGTALSAELESQIAERRRRSERSLARALST